MRDYKLLEDKLVNVDQLRGHVEAVGVVRDAVDLYRERIAATRPPSG